ncbi:hypothetical protein EZ55_02471 [Alteromonas macleodii]|jgi:hypothetical protein|nr:hypothetical protein EZ55_02471 [Alteromonas macleodii]VTP56051.1 hypothetical protein EZ55_02471 [Alteromonas macleodii]
MIIMKSSHYFICVMKSPSKVSPIKRDCMEINQKYMYCIYF